MAEEGKQRLHRFFHNLLEDTDDLNVGNGPAKPNFLIPPPLKPITAFEGSFVSTNGYHIPYESTDDSFDTLSEAMSHDASAREERTILPPPGFTPLVVSSTGINKKNVSAEIAQYVEEASFIGLSPGIETQRYISEQRARKNAHETARLNAAKASPKLMSSGSPLPQLHLQPWNPKEEDLEAFIDRFEKDMKPFEITGSLFLKHFVTLLSGVPIEVSHCLVEAVEVTDATKERKKKKNRSRKVCKVSTAADADEAAMEKKIKKNRNGKVYKVSAAAVAVETATDEKKNAVGMDSTELGTERSMQSRNKQRKKRFKVREHDEVSHPRTSVCKGNILKAPPTSKVVGKEVSWRNKLRRLPVNGKCYVSFYRNNLSKPQWEGPFNVVKRVTDISYLVHVNGYNRLFNINRLWNCLRPPHAFVPNVSAKKEFTNNFKKSKVKCLDSKFLPSADKQVISKCTNPSKLQGSRRNNGWNRHLPDPNFSFRSLGVEALKENEIVKKNLLKLVRPCKLVSGAASSWLDKTPASTDGQIGNACTVSKSEPPHILPNQRRDSPRISPRKLTNSRKTNWVAAVVSHNVGKGEVLADLLCRDFISPYRN